MSIHSAGVYFEPNDYLGVGRRLFIDFIDTSAAIVLSVIATWILLTVWPLEESLGAALLASWVLIWFCYFVLLKRSRFRTLGYFFGGARIVNLQGERPGIFSLLARLLFVAGGPANFFIDLFWIPSDPCRQAIRDKFAHTYVVRKNAVPAGSGVIVYRTYVMLGTTFLFQEVKGSSADAADQTPLL